MPGEAACSENSFFRPVSISKQSGLCHATSTTRQDRRQQGLCARADQTLRLIAEKHWRLQMEKDDAEEHSRN